MKTVVNFVLNDFTRDSRVLKISRSLASHNFNVCVVALHEEGLPIEESVEDFAVKRLKLSTRSWGKNKPVQLLKYLEFIIRSISFLRRADFVHCNDLAMLPIGVLAKLVNKKVKVIYDAHEFEAEVNGLTKTQRKIRRFVEGFLIRFADSVITVSPSIAGAYQARYRLVKLPYVILNAPNTEALPTSKLHRFRDSLGLRDDQIIFLYQGGLSRGRGLSVLLQTFEAKSPDSCVLVCMGYGPLEGEVRSAAERSPNIFYHEAVDPRIVLEYTCSADYGISLIEDICLSYRYCLPNKLFEFMFSGLPVIVSKLPEMERVVSSLDAGVVCDEHSVRGLNDAMDRIVAMNYEELSHNARSACELYSWEHQEKVLFEAYE